MWASLAMQAMQSNVVFGLSSLFEKLWYKGDALGAIPVFVASTESGTSPMSLRERNYRTAVVGPWHIPCFVL